MLNSSSASGLVIFGVGIVAAVGLGVLFLYLRDRYAASHGKSMQQASARFSALVQFYRTLQLCIPGVMVIILGVFLAFDRSREHDPEWPIGLLFIPVGWFIVWLLARKSWRRYLELQRQAEGGQSRPSDR